MGTISDKLVYLDGTREKIKENLNKFGSNITENNTFRSYSNVINDIYDKLPKVSGNGSNFSLENVQNGKLDSFGMDGNTEQTTYSGNQLVDFNNMTSVPSSTQYTFLNNELTITSNLTYAGINYDILDLFKNNVGKKIKFNYESVDLSNYNSTSSVIVQLYLTQNETDYFFSIAKKNTNTSLDLIDYTIPNNANEYTRAIIRFLANNSSSAQESEVKITKPLIYFDNNNTYEPYVGGTPSPNPDYPQEVKVVENKQIVNVHGKNLIEGSQDFSGIWNNSQNWETDTNSYNNLIVKKNQGTWNGINKEIYITAGTYTFSLFAKSDSARTVNIYLGGTLTTDNLIPQSKQLNLTTEWQRYDVTFTSNANGTVKPRLENPTQISNNYTYVCGYQLQQGNLTEYEPYQSQDYEIDLLDYKLCKIDTYKDSIKKSTGKNLFDKDSVILGKVWNGASNTKRAYGYIEAIQGQVYTASTQDTSSDLNIYITETASVGTGGEHIKQTELTSTLTFTPQSDTKYIVVQFTATTNDITQEMVNNALIQIEENNQATDYEPYGTDWYIKKNIGKVVVDTSNITLKSNYTNIEYAEITKPNDFIGKDNYDDYNVYCSHAISDIKNAIQYAWDSTYRIGKITNKATTSNLWLGFPKGTGLDNIKIVLNGAVIYYVLATPTYEKITNSTLISQLESIETFTGLNYFSVSNENNVLPTLYVSRLKELGKLE